MAVLTSSLCRSPFQDPKANVRRPIEPGNIIRLAILMTLGIVAVGVAIGAFMPDRELRMTVAIFCGLLIAEWWACTLIVASLILLFRFLRALFERISRALFVRSSHTKLHKPDVRIGVADGWIDGPF